MMTRWGGPALCCALGILVLSCGSEPKAGGPPPPGRDAGARGDARPAGCGAEPPKLGDLCTGSLSEDESCSYETQKCEGPFGEYPLYSTYCCVGGYWDLCSTGAAECRPYDDAGPADTSDVGASNDLKSDAIGDHVGDRETGDAPDAPDDASATDA